MRVRVLGGGIVGLACADELLRRGHDVTVVDRTPGTGASWAAAGMLTPGVEAWWGEPEVFRLGSAAAAMWPAYAARLGVRLHDSGTLLAAHDAGDLQRLERQVEVLAGLGVTSGLLGHDDVRRFEPGLARLAGGALLAEGSVDPREVVAALLRRLGDRVVPDAPADAADVTVLATGARLPEPFAHLVRGVRGEVLRLRTDQAPRHTVRGWVAGEPVYLVPRGDGRLVVGATMEEHDEPPVVTAGSVLRLLRAARGLLPAVDGAELVECTARDRPASPDHLPLIGPTHLPGVHLAAGLFRHGVLMAPLAARLLADCVEGAAPDPAVDPRRFPLDAPLDTEGAPACA